LSEKHAQKVLKEVYRQLEVLPTHDIANQSWEHNGQVFVAESAAEAVQIMNDYAPEHLELLVTDQTYYFKNLINYGSLFIGEETTVAYGDKSIREASIEIAKVTSRQCRAERMIAHALTAEKRINKFESNL
jgi:sulfopropanediol 3-dehydrogenase